MKTQLQLSADELKMAEEVFEVMEKYNKGARRFGIQLIHSHFHLNPGEVLHETHDSYARVLEIRPTKIEDFQEMPLATSWYRDADKRIVVNMFCCDGPPGVTPPGK